MSKLDDAYRLAELLQPYDQLRLIVRLWSALPPEHWAAPTGNEIVDAWQRLSRCESEMNDEVPWDIVRHIVADPAHRPKRTSAKIYSAPRRFDLATIFAVTAAYSILLGGMSALTFPPVASCYVAAFITTVGIGQAVLFGGAKPRMASVISGVAAWIVGIVSYAFVNPYMYEFISQAGGGLPFFALSTSAVFGSLLGYVAGVLVGGVFLVADVLRRRNCRDGNEESNDTMLEVMPDGQSHG